MSSSAEDQFARDPLYGWVVVISVFVLSAVSFGALASVSVFLKPLSDDFGWSRATVSFGYSLISFGSAIFGVLWGYLADKYGTRWFGLIATFIMSGALFLLSKHSNLTQFYALYFLFGAFGSSLVGAPLYANVGFWFRKNPGLAIGLAASGGAAGQGIVPYICGRLIETNGWQAAYVYLSFLYLVMALPFAFLIKESPRRNSARLSRFSEPRDFPISEKEAIIWICFAVIFCCICMSVPIVHLVPLLTDRGFSMEFATSMLMVAMLVGILGRILGGKLGDMIGALPAYLIMSAGQTILVLWFPYVQSPIVLYILAACFGFAFSGVMSSILVCARMMVSAKLAGRAISFTSFFGWFGMGTGGFLGGYFFDLTGDYFLSFQVACVAGLVNLLILWQFYRRIYGKDKSVRIHHNA